MKQIVTEYAIRELTADLVTQVGFFFDGLGLEFEQAESVKDLKATFAQRIADWLTDQAITHDEIEGIDGGRNDDARF